MRIRQLERPCSFQASV
uniref:Uncharacterized protein n=1 Tax=Anguilla anguilla TaxID=7936 RepID=A0A0E9P6V6_ANGAN